MTKVHASLKSASEDKADESISKSVPTFMVDPRIVKAQEDFNARPIDPEHVTYLKGLRKAGVDVGYYTLQMIDGEATLRDGHHRHAADMELIAEGFPIQRVKAIEFKGDEKAAILLMLATGSNKTYTPLQVGEQYVKLVNKYGMSYAEIAETRGLSVQNVKDAMRLTEQPVELKEMIKSGAVTSTTALKLVKKEGATKAVETLRQAASAPGIKAGKGITQKVLDNLGHAVIEKAKGQRDAAVSHLDAMLDSPAFDGPTKAALRDVIALIHGKTDRIVVSRKTLDAHVDAWLDNAKNEKHSDVKTAAHLLSDHLHKRPIPADTSGSAAWYRHMVWLQDLAAKSQKPTFRAGAHWFLAVLNADRTGGDLAPAPSVLDVEGALRAEKESGGHVMAETLCPEQAALITWARGREQ